MYLMTFFLLFLQAPNSKKSTPVVEDPPLPSQAKKESNGESNLMPFQGINGGFHDFACTLWSITAKNTD